MTVRSQIANRNGTQPDTAPEKIIHSIIMSSSCHHRTHSYSYKILEISTFRHPSIVSRATTIVRTKCADALENGNVSLMGAGVFIVQKLAGILFAQADALVQRVIRERRQSRCINGLVFIVKRIGLLHVVVAIQVPVF